MATQYRVIAPYVTVQTDTPQGRLVVGLYEGAPIPEDVRKEQIDHLLNNNLIEKVGAAPVDRAAAAARERAATEEAAKNVEVAKAASAGAGSASGSGAAKK